MINFLAEANSFLENGSNLFGIVLGFVAVAGVLITCGKLIAVLSANTKATSRLTEAMDNNSMRLAKVENILAVHAEKHVSHERNIAGLWDKVNRTDESGTFPKKK